MTITSVSSLSLPIFNTNGTDAGAIEDEYAEATMLIRKARRAIASCTCHPRDFQFQPPTAFNQARLERENVLSQLDEIESYLTTWYWSAVDQNPEHTK